MNEWDSKPALTPEKWAYLEKLPGPDTQRGIALLEDDHGAAAWLLNGKPYGFTEEMLNGIYTLLWYSGTGFCPRCTKQDFDGGSPTTCRSCGWHVVKPGTERELAAQGARRISALLREIHHEES